MLHHVASEQIFQAHSSLLLGGGGGGGGGRKGKGKGKGSLGTRLVFSYILGPNSLIFSFSSGASPAHNAGGQVLPLFSQQAFLMKEVDKRDGKMIITHCRRVLLDAVL